MCGRFTISVEPGELAKVLGVERILEMRPRYEIVGAVRGGGSRA
jgi:hypothetical protein